MRRICFLLSLVLFACEGETDKEATKPLVNNAGELSRGRELHKAEGVDSVQPQKTVKGRSDAPEARGTGDVALMLDAVLEDAGHQSPQPGGLYVIGLMRYRVLRVVEGEYALEHVYVGHHWADVDGPEFQAGVHHRLALSKEFPAGAILLNPYEVGDDGVFYCTSFQLLEGP